MRGIILIDKPKEYTSHDVVAKVKKILNVQKVGHTGTLDPNATGVLPLLLNDATKLSKYLIEHDKTYEVILKLGIKTDTLDEEGTIIEEREVEWKKDMKQQIEHVLYSLLGKQMQTPPMYSAIKVDGKKLYEYAREGKKIEVPTREITIYHIELMDMNEKEKTITFRVECSKGTYVRSICETIAQKLNTIGYMKELRRTQVGRFTIQQAVSLEELEKQKDNIEWLDENILQEKQVFPEKETIQIDQKKLPHFLNGVKITINRPDGIYHIETEDGTYIGLGIIKQHLLKRDVVYPQD